MGYLSAQANEELSTVLAEIVAKLNNANTS
jgi:hypothetical protein